MYSLPFKNANATLVYQSVSMRKVVDQISLLSSSRSTILITGESGTGKEIVARTIHKHSGRARGPFIAYNCSSIPRELAESELFGHRKGAFTGANIDYLGIIRCAAGGTIFLDEIGDLPLEIQPKLLRFLEQGEIQPLGTSKLIEPDVRVITATNRDLKKMVAEGLFRTDLWHRINVINIALPPLRDRREDIPLLVDYLLRMFSERDRKPGLRLAPDVLEKLMQYDWPGNVRELANQIERMVVFTPPHSEITNDSLSSEIRFCMSPFISGNEIGNGAETVMENMMPARVTKLVAIMDAYEQVVIRDALKRHNGNKTRAANELGISREWLRQKLKKSRTGNNSR